MTDVTTDTATIAASVDAYLAALTETDATARADLVERAWAEDGYFVDPLLEAQGRPAIADLTLAVTGQFPGHTFRRTTGLDAHHGLVRFGWELVAPDGAVAAAGLDVGIVAEDGRLSRVAGFFGDPPTRDDR
jgi:hypothetical protein